jgi:Fe-S-cluster containining protein
MPHFPIKRSQLKPGEVLCSYCTALCCRYFSLPIEMPKTWKEFDTIRWFMMHGTVSVYVDDGTWYLCVYADCKHLEADNRCGIYDDRPRICRNYSTRDCEYDDLGLHDRLFETPEQLWEYAEAVLPPRRRRGAKQRVSLPVLASTG